VYRTLRAFAWMRWRLLVNSLERTGARDRLERLSLAVDQVGPIIALVLLVPSAIGLAALGGYAGYWLAAGQPGTTFEVVRAVLLGTCVFAVVGPLMLPSMPPTAIVRWLLLPIPRRTLYAAQAFGALSEPWVIIAFALVTSAPVGFLAGRLSLAPAVALLAGLLLVVCLVGLSTLSSLLLHLVVRDRRRGELAALFFIVLIPVLSLMPLLLTQSSDRSRGEGHRQHGRASMPVWVSRAASSALRAVPSELYTRAARASALREATAAIPPLVGLLAWCVLLHGAGFLAFARLLETPSAGARRSQAGRASSRLRIPLVSRASAAIAQTQVRLAMRTPRGRSIVLSPLIMFAIAAVVVFRRGEMEIAGISMANGFGLATFGGIVALLSIQPFAVNQFAIDRAGLTMALLSPIDARQLLVGKALGLGLMACGSAILCALLAVVLVPGGSPALWLSLPPGFVAAYALAAPAAAMVSALFPRAVDLNSVGRGSNPHTLATLTGLLALVVATLPVVLVAVVTTVFLAMTWLTPILLLMWCGVALLLSHVLFGAAAILFDKRRENLGVVAS
jgi:hypothetical protein